MRYQIKKGSHSGHCCFDYTVIDTARPANEERAICECMDEADAVLIAGALNAWKEPHP